MSAPVVTVQGEAQVEGPPDLAALSCTVHRAGDSADRVRTGLADASAQVRSVLGEFGSAVEFSTSGLHVSPVSHRRTPTKVTGYRGTFSSQVQVSDFSVLSPVVLALSRIPDSQIDGPWWSLRPDNPMYARARLLAIAEARRRAVDYAGAFGATLADLVEVSDLGTGFGGARDMRAFAMSKGAEESEFDFEPTRQTVSGQVTVRFTLSKVDLGALGR